MTIEISKLVEYMKESSLKYGGRSEEGYFSSVTLSTDQLPIESGIEYGIAWRVAHDNGVTLSVRDFSPGEDMPGDLRPVFAYECESEKDVLEGKEKLESAVDTLNKKLKAIADKLYEISNPKTALDSKI